MFASDRHPDDETLRLFAVGRLAESQGDEIEKHLAGCEVCSRRLDDIERRKSDSLLREMQAVRLVDRDAEPSGDFTPGVRIGNFRLENRLGRGGMGEAWKAFDDTAKRHVVLKFVPKDVQHVAEAMNAVLDSFQKIHSLQHSHICPVYLLDNDPEHGYFVVMKFIDGLPLDVYQRRNGPIPFDETVRILRDVAGALDYAHSRKVVHRDVKPANIMIGETDGVQLIDFGLADEIRATLSAEIPATRITGTRSYMAPEQWTGQKQDARTDQYALAITAYELLAGHVPFSGTDTEILKNAVLHDPPSPIPDLPEHVNAALLRGLAKRRENRFESCRAFVEALTWETIPSRLPPTLPSATVKPALWKWIAPAIVVSIFILFVSGIYLIRQSLNSDAGADVAAVGKPIPVNESPAAIALHGDFEKDLNGPDTKSETPPNPPRIDGFEAVATKGQAESKTPSFYRPNLTRNSELFRVVRLTLELDPQAAGRLIVIRGVSAAPLPSFRGTQFASDTFRNALLFRGQDGMGRIVFPTGDTSLTPKPGNLSPQQTTPFGWEYWSEGGSYVSRYGGSTRFALKGNGSRAGVSLGKACRLSCAITFEVVDNDDNLPYLELTLYQDVDRKSKICTISCWGEKETNGRLRMSATYSHPFTEGKQTFIVEDAAVEKNAMFSQVFQLPPVVAKSVEAIQYSLWARRQTDRPMDWTGFDLTFLDIVGRFKADAGFTIDERGTVPVVGRVDPTGPAAFRLLPGAQILSINDRSGSASKLRETLDSLQFGDPVTVRIVPKGGGSGSTCSFHAE